MNEGQPCPDTKNAPLLQRWQGQAAAKAANGRARPSLALEPRKQAGNASHRPSARGTPECHQSYPVDPG